MKHFQQNPDHRDDKNGSLIESNKSKISGLSPCSLFDKMTSRMKIITFGSCCTWAPSRVYVSNAASESIRPSLTLTSIQSARTEPPSAFKEEQGIHLNSEISQACGMLPHDEEPNAIPSPRTGLGSAFMSLPSSIAIASLKEEGSAVLPENSASGLRFSG